VTRALRICAWLSLGAVAIAGAPSLAQEHPDFTGVWTAYASGPGQTALSGGGVVVVKPLMLTPEGQTAASAFLALSRGAVYTPGLYCVGLGMPASMLASGPLPMEIIQRPEQITVIYEAFGETRRLFLGDRAAEIDPDDVSSERNGFSIARWEGDTLVVDTDHLVEQIDSAFPHSDQARIVERYSLAAEGETTVLTAELTMSDPVFLAEPLVFIKKWRHAPQERLLSFECAESQWLTAIELLQSGVQPPLPLGSGAPRR
jgi:hypothetical protein